MFIKIIAAAISLILIPTVYLIFTSIATFIRHKNVPGPHPRIPLLGNALFFLRPNIPKSQLVDVVYTDLARLHKNDGFALFFVGHKVVIILFTPELISQFLKDNSLINKAIEYDYFKQWLGNGLITSSGNIWKTNRKLLNPTFHSKILNEYILTINEQCEQLINIITERNDSEYIDIRLLMTKLTLNIITMTAMGITLDDGCEKTEEYRKCLRSLPTLLISRFYNPLNWYDFIFNLRSEGKEAKRQIKILHDFTNEVIKKRRINFISGSEYGQSKQIAFLDHLLTMQSQNTSISDDDIREQVDTFMFAGHDTSSTALTFALLLVGNDSRVQNKIHEELNSVLGDDKQRLVNSDDLGRLTYIECVIKEVMRLFPPAPYIARRAVSDFKINDHKFKKETTVFISIRDCHRNDEVYEKSKEFIPERFENNNFPGAYFPFAIGPRNCIGQRYAMNEMKIALAHIFRNFKINSKDNVNDVIISADATMKSLSPIRIQFNSV